MKNIKAGVLEIHYEENGPLGGWPVILCHGFPYDIHAFDEVVPLLVEKGARVIRPYLRGFGPTRFIAETTPRVGQQAALGSDLLAFIDALKIDKVILGGYDWGGLSCCVVAALWPQRVAALVSYASYDINDIERMRQPFQPSLESVMWYQNLFQLERGRLCLEVYRKQLCRLLWTQWSPTWDFDDTTFETTAIAFENPDFVEVVINCYRHCFGLISGLPEYEELEKRLAAKPEITVPAVTLDGSDDPLKPGGTKDHAKMFTGFHDHRVVKCGHNLPQEKPEIFADAILYAKKVARY